MLQNCQKTKWGNPSYQKIANARWLQSVSISVPNFGKKKSQLEPGLHKIVVPLDYDPGSLQEAQNCVAIVALMKLFPNLRLDHMFQQPYSDVHFQLKKHSMSLFLEDLELT